MTFSIKETAPLITEVTVQHHSSGGKLTVHKPEAWMKNVMPHDLCVSVTLRDNEYSCGQTVWAALTPDDALALAEALTVFAVQQTSHLPQGLYV